MNAFLYQQALALHQAGNLQEAQKIYDAILIEEPNNVDILHLAGILAAQNNNFILSQQYLAHALEIEPNSPTIQNSMGNVLKNLCQFPAALQHYQKALQLQPNNAVLHNNIAIIHQQLKDYKTAIKHYHNALKLDANYADAHYNLSLALLNQIPSQQNLSSPEANQFNLNKAIEHLNITINLQPQHEKAHYQLAQLYQQQNKIDEAIKHYQKSLRIEQNNILAQLNLGGLLLFKNKFASSIRHFKKTILLDPLQQEAFYNLGVAFLRQNNFEAALKYFLRLTQLPQIKKDFDVYYNLGVIYNRIGRLNEAIIHFHDALKINMNDVATHVNLGAIYLKQENYQQALTHYNAALLLKPNDKELQYITAALTQNNTQNNEQNHQSQQQRCDTLATITACPAEYIQNLFNDYAENYDKHLTLLDYQAPQLIYEAVIMLIENQHLETHSQSWQILDLGCGTGLCGGKIRDLAKKLIGIDLSEKMLKIAAQKNIYDELNCGLIENILPHQYNNLDLIIAADTLPYAGDLDNIFLICKKTLKNKGFFIFTIEATQHYPYILQRTLRFAHHAQYIEKLSQKNDFAIIYSKKTFLRKHRGTNIECLIYILQSKKTS